MPEDLLIEIFSSVIRIQDLPGQDVFHDGVDGEIPSPCGSFDSEERIYEDVKVAVSLPGRGLLARHGDVDGITP